MIGSTDGNDLKPFRIGSDPWRIGFDPVRASAARLAFLGDFSASGWFSSELCYVRVGFHAGRRRERVGTEVIENLRTHGLVNNRPGGNAPLTIQVLAEMLGD
jgi:hypothetical protein